MLDKKKKVDVIGTISCLINTMNIISRKKMSPDTLSLTFSSKELRRRKKIGRMDFFKISN